jgi:hypothetical protein
MTNDIIIVVLILNAFFIGYLLGKNRQVVGVTTTGSFFDKNKSQTKESNIKIDDTKCVLDIQTNNLTKKYDELGEKTLSTDNISGSVNKLKNLKR